MDRPRPAAGAAGRSAAAIRRPPAAAGAPAAGARRSSAACSPRRNPGRPRSARRPRNRSDSSPGPAPPPRWAAGWPARSAPPRSATAPPPDSRSPPYRPACGLPKPSGLRPAALPSGVCRRNPPREPRRPGGRLLGLGRLGPSAAGGQRLVDNLAAAAWPRRRRTMLTPRTSMATATRVSAMASTRVGFRDSSACILAPSDGFGHAVQPIGSADLHGHGGRQHLEAQRVLPQSHEQIVVGHDDETGDAQRQQARIQADRRISAELADSSLRAWLTSRMKAAMRSST